jgi:CRISPR type III-B/RAMP module RAMP protein Cmr6
LLARYLRVPVPAKDSQPGSESESSHPKDRCLLYQAAINAAKSATTQVYQIAYQRRLTDLKTIASLAETLLKVRGRLIVGLGGENILETGITLHHTYGVPIIPGSALKGLASHYCHQVWGAQDERFRDKVILEHEGEPRRIIPQGKYHRILFGAQEDAGHIIFHDAWIEPESLLSRGLVTDVMTPHHSDYYAAKDDCLPTDFDSPNPITFLDVTGYFHVAVSCDAKGDKGLPWAELALELLTRALQYWGVGAKTNAGYGRMVRLDDGTSPPNPSEPKQIGPCFKNGDQVTVRRVEDPSGKGRTWFQAEDGVSGTVMRGIAPQVEIGVTATLWIVSVNNNYGTYNYNFSSEPPRFQRSKQPKKR